jgi:hypothetical protein
VLPPPPVPPGISTEAISVPVFPSRVVAVTRMNLKDGGSVSYKALAYEVTKIHQFTPEADDVKPYIDGVEIKILGMTVYRETY